MTKRFFNTPGLERELCDIWDNGTAIADIAKHFDCSTSTVRDNLHKLGRSTPTGRLSEAGRQRISESSKRQWAKGKTPPMQGKTHSESTKRKIALAHSGAKNYRWAGGRKKVKAKNGIDYYIYICTPDHPRTKGKSTKYVPEHHLVMEKHLGRHLLPGEEVHHRNGIKHDNRLENLEIVVHAEHFGEVKCPFCCGSFKIK